MSSSFAVRPPSPRTHMMPRDTERDEQAPGLAENRAHPRVKVHSLAYIELGQENAGLIVNISETGMAIQAVQTLSSTYLPRMHFRLPHTDALIQASGKVVWQIKPKKELGIEFDAISEQTRDVIRKWIATEENRQTESEEIHQRTLADFAKPVRQGTAFQKYPSESGDDDMEIPVPMTAPELATVDPRVTQVKFENRASTLADTSTVADTPALAEPPAPIQFPSAPRRLPDRWRPEPRISETHGTIPRPTSNRQPERVFGNASWNRRPTVSASRIESADKRPRWPYALVLILLAAVTLAGITTVDPGLIDIASIEAWVGRKTAWLKYTPPKSASPTQQANATSASANAASPTTSAQVPPVTQSQGPPQTQDNSANVPSTTPNAAAPSGAAPTETQTAQSNDNDANAALSTQSSEPTADSTAADASKSNSDGTSGTPNQRSSAVEPQSQRPSRPDQSRQASDKQPPPASGYGQEVPARSVENAAPPTNKQFAASPRTAPANNRASSRGAPVNSRAGNPQNQAPSRQSASDSEALQAWRAQTTLDSPSNTAPNSTKGAQNQTPARRNHQYQNAYANPAPHTAAPANQAAQPTTTQPQAFIVEMSGYPSSPVPPSMPLAGVPSGSVATNSQLHAIWVPTNLEWARQYLPGNLGVGRLLSSYSPAYPIEAAREGVQGTVKLDVTVAMDGTVRSVRVLGGPPILAHAAVAAVRDWRYGESFLAGQAIETQQYVSLVFRLAPNR